MGAALLLAGAIVVDSMVVVAMAMVVRRKDAGLYKLNQEYFDDTTDGLERQKEMV